MKKSTLSEVLIKTEHPELLGTLRINDKPVPYTMQRHENGNVTLALDKPVMVKVGDHV